MCGQAFWKDKWKKRLQCVKQVFKTEKWIFLSLSVSRCEIWLDSHTNLIWDSGDCRWRKEETNRFLLTDVTIVIDSSAKEFVFGALRGGRVVPPSSARPSQTGQDGTGPDRTYPRDDELPSQVLHFCFDFAADVELVAVQGDTLQVGQQVLFAGGVGTLQETDVTRHTDVDSSVAACQQGFQHLLARPSRPFRPLLGTFMS